jgi:hypothetical protein
MPTTTEYKLSGIKGPYTCATFDSCRPNVCAECPLWGKITSPIQIGTVIEEAETETIEDEDAGEPIVVYKNTGGEIPRYPFPYLRGKSGGVYVRQEDDDGNPDEVLVYMNDLYYTKRVVDYEAGECVIGKLHLPNDGVREFALRWFRRPRKKNCARYCRNTASPLAARRWEHVMAYTQAWIEQLQVNNRCRQRTDTVRME